MSKHVEYPINLIGISGKKNSGKDTVASMIQYLIARKDDSRDINIQTAEFLGLTKDNWMAIHNKQPFVIKRFADKVKDMTCILLGCSRQDLEDRNYKERELGEQWQYWQLNYGDFDFQGSAKFNSYNEAVEERKELLRLYDVDEPKLIKLTPRKVMQLLGTEGVRNAVHPNAWVISTFVNFNSIADHWIIPDVRFPNELEEIKKRGGLIIRVNRPQNEEKEADLHSSESSLDEAEFDYIIDNDSDLIYLMLKVKTILKEEGLI